MSNNHNSQGVNSPDLQYLMMNQGGGVIVPMGIGAYAPAQGSINSGFTTTNAKDHGKRSFNFTT